MISKKICLLGSFSVGKTSLIARYVKGIFSEKYLTTIGVKIDKKTVATEHGTAQLMIWDLNGADRYQSVRTSYLRGSAGIVYVVDGTREPTLETVLELERLVEETVGKIPGVLLFNKEDLRDEWVFGEDVLTELASEGRTVMRTSAKTGFGVEEAFKHLTRAMLAPSLRPS